MARDTIMITLVNGEIEIHNFKRGAKPTNEQVNRASIVLEGGDIQIKKWRGCDQSLIGTSPPEAPKAVDAA